MPVPELMTWVPTQRRWTKMYRGKRYYVSARQLGTAETKEASLHAANQWWRDKQAEIDHAARAPRTPAPMDDLAAASLGMAPDLLGDIRKLVASALLSEEARRPLTISQCADIEAVIPIEPPGGDPDPDTAEVIRRKEIMARLETLLFGEERQLPQAVATQLGSARTAAVERAAREIRGEAPAKVAPTMGKLSQDWLQGLKARASINDLSPVRYRTLVSRISHFVSFIGPDTPPAHIDAERLEGFYRHCLGKICDGQQGREGGWTAEYARSIFTVAQRMIRWSWERGVLELPKNLGSRNFRFKATVKAVPTWTAEEVQHVIGRAPGKLKLALLLMLNAGMTQGDVSDLMDREVDWRAGTITRRRSKTKDNENVPVVTYRLWPLTWQLLQEHRSGSERVLLTETGRPFVRRDLVEGKVREADMLSLKYRKLCKRTDFHKPMKQLRKTSATLLESHEVYGRLTSLFLGHAPQGMKERHYARPPQALFDEAVLWLGQQLGLAE